MTIVVLHAVEWNPGLLLPSLLVLLNHDRINREGNDEPNNFEWRPVDVPLQLGSESLPDGVNQHLLLSLVFDHDPDPLLQRQSLVSAELEDDTLSQLFFNSCRGTPVVNIQNDDWVDGASQINQRNIVNVFYFELPIHWEIVGYCVFCLLKKHLFVKEGYKWRSYSASGSGSSS